MFEIGPNTRLRVSPFFEKTVEEGVTAFSPYNKMLMPRLRWLVYLNYRYVITGGTLTTKAITIIHIIIEIAY